MGFNLKFLEGWAFFLKNPFCGEGMDILRNIIEEKNNNHIRNHYITFITKIE